MTAANPVELKAKSIMSLQWSGLIDGWRLVRSFFSFRRGTAPIDSLESLEHFVATRAAYVAQKTLYGYLKTRIGTRFPRVFDDEIFVKSINIAKFHVFAACLSALAVYATALALEGEAIADEIRKDTAFRCYRHGLDDNIDQMPEEFSAEESLDSFQDRLAVTDWGFGAKQRENFTRSPETLLKWAPIADHLKAEDAEIVENSIKFAWRDIREQFQKRLDRKAMTDGVSDDRSRLPL